MKDSRLSKNRAAVAAPDRRAAAVAAVSAPAVVAVAAARSLAADPRAVDSFCIEELKVWAPPASRVLPLSVGR